MTDDARCPACGHGTVEAGVCARCGYAQGKGNECPHCGSVARAEPVLRRGSLAVASWRCAVCGGPRIPGGFGGEAARDALREERAHLGRAMRRRGVTIGFGALAAMSLFFMLGVSLISSAFVVYALTFAIPAAFALVAARSLARVKDARDKARDVHERAWLAAAEDLVARSKAGLSPAELGKKLTIDPETAEALLTKLAVHDRARIDVGDDAEVRYSVTPEARVRISDEPEEPVNAEEEALAARRESLP